MIKLNDMGVENLAIAVLKQTAKDIKNGDKLSEHQVINGYTDIFFDILSVKMPKHEFVEKAKQLTKL